MPPCSILSNIRYVSRVKYSNPGKGVVTSPTPRCGTYWKGSLLVALNYGRPKCKGGHYSMPRIAHWHNCQNLHQWSGRLEFNPRLRHIKDSKNVTLMPPCLILIIIRYGSRVRREIQGKDLHSPLHPNDVAIEKGTIGSPWTTVGQLKFIRYIFP